MDDRERAVRLKQEWMELHKNSDSMVFDSITGLPLKAIYIFPLGVFVKERMEEEAVKRG